MSTVLKRTLPHLYPMIPLLSVIVLAEALARNEVIPAYLFPAPTQIWASFMASPAEFIGAFLQTCLASAIGFGLSITIGLLWALAMSYSKIMHRMFYPYAIFFQTVPILAIAPLLVIWFGYGMPTVVAASFIVSIFPIIANSVMGLTQTDPLLLNVFRMAGATPLQILFRLRVPYGLPDIMGGFKIAAGLSVIGAIVGEFITGGGLGGLVDTARNQQRIDRVFATVVLAALLGILFFSFISILNRILLRRWRELK